MSNWKMLSGVCAMILSSSALAADKAAAPSALNFKMKSIQGKEVNPTSVANGVIEFQTTKGKTYDLQPI